MIKKTLKFILKYLLLLFILFALLIIANLIPKSIISDNVKKSAEIFNSEGYFPRVKFAYNYLLDNYTDALMINTAYSVDSNSPIISAILMRRGYRADEEMELVDLGNEDTPIELLVENINETNKTYSEYSRYWGGYIIYLRPLLAITNYQGIRIILSIIINLLFIITAWLIYKKINIKWAISFIITMFIFSIHVIGLSMQYSSVFIITLISCIYLLMRVDKIKNINFTFFIIGSITCFMDLLTCPIITFGLPLIILMGLMKDKVEKEKLIKIIKLGIFWILGFSITWLIKWIISDIICNTGTFTTVINQIIYYTGINSQAELNVTIMQSIFNNLYFVMIPFIVLFILCVMVIEWNAVNKKNRKNYIVNIFPYLLISIIPFVWYIFTKNHSYIHARFTYRDICVTFMSYLIIILNNINIKMIKKEGKK